MRKGFTLLELLIVVVILGVLALIAAPTLLNAADQAKLGAVRANVSAAASTVTSQFALNTTDTTAEIVDAVVAKLNTDNKNPITGAASPYASGATGTAGQVALEPTSDTDGTAVIVIRGFDKAGAELIVKRVAAPASSNS